MFICRFLSILNEEPLVMSGEDVGSVEYLKMIPELCSNTHTNLTICAVIEYIVWI